jgi:hypothetical protein
MAATMAPPLTRDSISFLNLAVGGQFDNYTYPPDTFTSADMAVDYVRIYAQ